MKQLLVLGLIVCAGSTASAASALDAYFDAWLKIHPLSATELGVHTYDRELPQVDEASQRAWAKRLRVHRKQVLVIPKGCDAACQIDHAITVGSIDAELFDLEELRPYERWPDAWVGVATGSVFALVKRSFAPLADRADLVEARLTKLPAVYEAARVRLTGKLVAPVAIDIAREDLRGAIEFIGGDVDKAFEPLPKARRAKLRTSIDAAIAALKRFDAFLDAELRPKAHADIAIGPQLLAKKLLVDESIDEPLDPLLARGTTELRRLQEAFRTAAKAWPSTRPTGQAVPREEASGLEQDPRALKRLLDKNHPKPAEVLGVVRGTLAGLRTFLVDQHIVTVPSEIMPIVEETPPFMRAMTQASIDSPGPFETVAHEAYYHVTLPDPSWDAKRTESYLSGALSRSLIDVVSIHEAFPGHYLQFLWVPKLTSRARRMISPSSNVEGWAHYCEQMMLDAGWAKDKPEVRLSQLSDALLRAARYVVAIRMHAKGMTVAEAQRFFVDEGYQTDEVAVVEAKRATEDPTFLYYTWGKLQFLALRGELQQKWGKDFSLQRFHDAVMAEGPLPLPLLEKAMRGALMIALVTCRQLPHPDEDEPLLVAALRARGAEVELVAWDDETVDWSRYDVAVVRSTWNYIGQHARFVRWAEATAKQTRLYNGTSTIAWNTDKAYLLRLAELGIPTVPTRLVARGSTESLRVVAAGWSEVVVKPRISAGSFETRRFSTAMLVGNELARCAAERDVLVQPYVTSVESHGERALVWIDGELVHSVRKSPRFSEDEPDITPAAIADDERAFVATLIGKLEPLLYARIDVARADDGSPQLMELELVEPSLFLVHSPPALTRFADAIVTAARRPPAA